MGNDTMDLQQLASYLRRDLREVSKLVSRGHVPGHKVSGQWRFHPAEITHWLETQLHGYTDEQLIDLETVGGPRAPATPQVSELLAESCMAVPLRASSKSSVLRELVRLAETSFQVYDSAAVLDAVLRREDVASTALPNGVALPHPRRLSNDAFGDPVIAYGRTMTGIPFGGTGRTTTDVFFLVLCRDDSVRLRVLARVARLVNRPDILDELRSAETPAETLALIEAAERELVGD